MTIRSEHARWLHEYESELKRTGENEMGRYSSDAGGGDFKQCPPGNHVARCVKLIDIGTQRGTYQGQETIRKQIIMQWEVPGETVDVGGEPKPMLVSKFLTDSLNEKATMRGMLEAWRGRPFTQAELKKFDKMNLLGVPCMVNVIHDDNGRAKVQSVAQLPKGVTCPPAHNEPSAFWLDDWDDNAFSALPEGFKKFIVKSDEYRAMFETGRSKPKDDDGYADMRRPAEEPDDIPF